VADVVVFVVDATVGHLDEDDAVVRVLRRSGLPIMLIANKVDDAATEAEAASLWSLGLGEPHPISALHGRGSGDLLDGLVAMLREEGRGAGRESGPRRVALLGRPNVGKSSLLNQRAGENRVVVGSALDVMRRSLLWPSTRRLLAERRGSQGRHHCVA